jgi:hypothetical protein
MPWLSAAASVVGGLLGASGAESAADTQAAAALEAARIQAEAAKLKPSTVRSGFGTADISLQGDRGIASYTLAPELQRMRDLLYGQAFTGMPSTATSDYYNQMRQLAQQRSLDAMRMSPDQAASSEVSSIMGLLSPQRAREEASLAHNLFKTGRMGAGTSYGVGGGYINPQQYALLKAREEQNQQLAMTALDRARQKQITDITDYFNMAGKAPEALRGLYSGQAGLFNLGADAEKLGMSPLDFAASLSGRATNASANAGAALAQGMTNAANYQAAGSQVYPLAISRAFDTLGQRPITGQNPYTGAFQYGPSAFDSASNWLKGLWGGQPTSQPTLYRG